MDLSHFFAELRRRNVYKVAVGYGVVGWLVIQVAATIVPALHLPDSLTTVVVVVILLGFPIALVIAWAFEMTPDGMKRTENISPNDKNPQWSRRKFAAFVFVVGFIAAALLVWQMMRSRESQSRIAAEKSIAVLPFASLSEDKSNAYFADGIQDEILTRLSKIGGIKVISRTSTRQYESKPGNLAEIAKQLGVAHILEGSVQKAGESVRVNVQLIKAAGDSHLWAETYDRKLTDIFAVESEVAQRIADSLEAKLTGREKAAINYVGTKVPAAYDAYLRAIALRNSQARKDQMQLIEYCRQAVALDPDYAAAWVELTYAEGLRYVQGERTPAQRETVRVAAENALRLDPNHGGGHAAMGMYLYYCLQEYDKALEQLFQARQQAPNDAVILQAVGLVRRRQGKLDEAIEYQLQAAQLDPRNQDIWLNIGWSYRGQRRFAEAHTMFNRALAIAPNDPDIIMRNAETTLAEGNLKEAAALAAKVAPPLGGFGYGTAIYVLILERKYDEVIAKTQRDLANAGDDVLPIVKATGEMVIGTMHLSAGRESEGRASLLQAEKELKALRDQGNNSPGLRGSILGVQAWLGRRAEVERDAAAHIAAQAKDRWTGLVAEEDAARAFVLVGETERALDLLERLSTAVYADSITPALLRLDPIWDKIRHEPRFQKLANTQP